MPLFDAKLKYVQIRSFQHRSQLTTSKNSWHFQHLQIVNFQQQLDLFCGATTCPVEIFAVRARKHPKCFLHSYRKRNQGLMMDDRSPSSWGYQKMLGLQGKSPSFDLDDFRYLYDLFGNLHLARVKLKFPKLWVP